MKDDSNSCISNLVELANIIQRSELFKNLMSINFQALDKLSDKEIFQIERAICMLQYQHEELFPKAIPQSHIQSEQATLEKVYKEINNFNEKLQILKPFLDYHKLVPSLKKKYSIELSKNLNPKQIKKIEAELDSVCKQFFPIYCKEKDDMEKQRILMDMIMTEAQRIKEEYKLDSEKWIKPLSKKILATLYPELTPQSSPQNSPKVEVDVKYLNKSMTPIITNGKTTPKILVFPSPHTKLNSSTLSPLNKSK
jgi:hypothetical protein